MSWNPFKSKEVTTVGTQVQRVIDDASLPQSIRAGAIKALFQDGNITDYTLEELVASIGARAEKMYRYADSKYTWGLPSGEIYSSTQGKAQVEQAIEQIEGQQVSMEYSHYGSVNVLHVGWIKLIADYGYDPETNELKTLSTQKGKTVYLKDMIPLVPVSQITTIEHVRIAAWGTPANSGPTPLRSGGMGRASSVATSSTAADAMVQATAIWSDGTYLTDSEGNKYLKTFEQTIYLDTSGYDTTANYFQAKYYLEGKAKFWTYKMGVGTYVALDQVYTQGPAVNGSYFPFLYFRFDKHSTNSDKSSAAYKTSKKAAKILGVDFDAMADAINENPDIGDVEQAMMVLGLPAQSSDKLESRYLFDYFDSQYLAMDGASTSSEAAVLRGLTGDPSWGNWTGTANAVAIQDRRFKMALSNSGIFKRLVAGSIGPIGTYTSSYEPYTAMQTLTDADGFGYEQAYVIKLHKYRHQLSKGIYEEIVVQDLSMTYYIWNGYNTTGDENDTILLIPIDRTISERYSLKDREQLYARSLHLVFNARTTQKIKWYQQEWFRIVLIVIAVVLTVMDGGTDGGSWIASVLELTGTEAIIATAIFNLAVGLVIMPAVFKLFVKVFGQQAAEIVAIAALIYSIYTLSVNGVKGAPLASDLLMLSSGLEQAVLRVKFSDLQTEEQSLRQYQEEEQKRLDEAQKLLETSTVLNPIVIFGEKPEDFYNRTIHFGNIGTLGITAISSYVDIALTLPKIYDTLGEPNNG